MNGRGHTHRSRRVNRVAARLIVLGAVLAGLFAMHGLSDHGASGHRPMAESHVATTHTSSDDVAETLSDLDVAGQPSVSPADMSMDAMGLCLAVLSLALALLGVRRHVWPFASIARLRTHLSSGVPLRPRKPPDLLALGIQRC